VGPRRSLRDEDLDAVIGAVLRATQAFVGLALRSLSAAGTSITLPQYRMLVTLDAKGDQNVRDLAAGLGVDRSTATRMCNRLVTTGLIDRTTDPSDRRAVVISLTGPGRSVVAAVTKSRRENVARLLRSVPPSRRVQLVDLLGEFAELAERDPG
jgi:DNA-binding MarR family transcriptional regulator